MLGLCRLKLASEPEEVRRRADVRRADMRDFDLGREFSLVTLPFRSFQHLLTVADQLACLSRVREHLAPRGRLVLDVFNPSIAFLAREPSGDEAEPPFRMPDGRTVARICRVVSRDLFRQVQNVELVYDVEHPGGLKERVVHAFPMRYFFRFEVEHLLRRSGFALDAVHADFAGNPYGSTYPGEMIFVARRE